MTDKLESDVAALTAIAGPLLGLGDENSKIILDNFLNDYLCGRLKFARTAPYDSLFHYITFGGPEQLGVFTPLKSVKYDDRAESEIEDSVIEHISSHISLMSKFNHALKRQKVIDQVRNAICELVFWHDIRNRPPDFLSDAESLVGDIGDVDLINIVECLQSLTTDGDVDFVINSLEFFNMAVIRENVVNELFEDMIFNDCVCGGDTCCVWDPKRWTQPACKLNGCIWRIGNDLLDYHWFKPLTKDSMFAKCLYYVLKIRKIESTSVCTSVDISSPATNIAKYEKMINEASESGCYYASYYLGKRALTGFSVDKLEGERNATTEALCDQVYTAIKYWKRVPVEHLGTSRTKVYLRLLALENAKLNKKVRPVLTFQLSKYKYWIKHRTLDGFQRPK